MVVRRSILAILLAALPATALGHRQHTATPVTPEENEWLERQRSVDDTKCCNDRDIYVGQDVEWRLVQERGHAHYEVWINENWVRVPPGRILLPNQEDPSPFGNQALLFWMPMPRPGNPRHIELFCFRPDPLG